MTSDPLAYRIAFSALKGINMPLARRILAAVGSEQAFFETSAKALAAILGGSSPTLSDDERTRALEQARAECQFLQSSSSVRLLYFTDADYPQRLAECDDAPLMLYATGDCNLNRPRVMGIVGTRHATPYGAGFVEDVVKSLARRVDGLLIVSGLAYGIDSIAHRQALANHVPTVGVVAHGINTLYPSAHRSLAASMVRDGGMILTEYRHDTPVHRGNFLARNRIIAGLCDCVLVVESAIKGGAMVTARLACEYDRQVFALPGRINDPYSEGTNALITGHQADLVGSADDIINLMNWPSLPSGETQMEIPMIELNPDQMLITEALRENPLSNSNTIAMATGLPVARVTSALIDMELNGLVRGAAGSRYTLVS